MKDSEIRYIKREDIPDCPKEVVDNIFAFMRKRHPWYLRSCGPEEELKRQRNAPG